MGSTMPKSGVASPVHAWRQRLAGQRVGMVRPDDAPQAHAPGDDPDRVLLVGSGPAASWGVRSHELGLAGQLARHLSALTGRGSDVDVHGAAVQPVAAVADALRDSRLWRYDALVLTTGADDAAAFVTLAEWERRIGDLLVFLLSSSSSSTRLVVAGVPPVLSAPGLLSPLVSAMDAHARRMNQVTRRLCDS